MLTAFSNISITEPFATEVITTITTTITRCWKKLLYIYNRENICFVVTISPQIYKLDKMYLPPSGLHPLLSCLASKPLLANSASSLTKRYFASVALFRKTIVTRRANLNTIFNTVFDDYMETSSCFSSIFWLGSSAFL